MSRDASVVAGGKEVFQQYCVACHLESMRGKVENAAVIGPDLTDNIWEYGGAPTEIVTTITQGLIDKGMPVWGDIISEDKISAVTAYILSRHEIGAAPAGDPAAGQASAMRKWGDGRDPVPLPSPQGAPVVSQIFAQVPVGFILESLCVNYADGSMILYDLGERALHSLWTNARIWRDRVSRRTYFIEGDETAKHLSLENPLALVTPAGRHHPKAINFLGYTILRDGVKILCEIQFAGHTVEQAEVLRLTGSTGSRRMERALSYARIPLGQSLELRTGVPKTSTGALPRLASAVGQATETITGAEWTIILGPDANGQCRANLSYAVPDAAVSAHRTSDPAVPTVMLDPAFREAPFRQGSTRRPGYRAIRYPLPMLDAGEPRVMPFALATDPKTGRLYIGSGKLGEVFVLSNPSASPGEARFTNFGGGLFQDVFGILPEGDSVLVSHRRNVTRLRDTDGDNVADRFEHVATLPQSSDPTSYDFAYGMVRDKSGHVVLSFAPHANKDAIGSGGVVRIVPHEKEVELEEIAYGLRNPVGWASGPDGEVFFTDNQGNWVATNRLSHLVPDRFYGFVNSQQPQHAKRTMGPTPIWVPYSWAKCINGVAYDTTGGKFGPFAGQFFLAELMEGGAIIRAQLEKVNGQYQGACFPFWNRGLLAPLTLAFDNAGHLWVGSITENGWLRQPDRGALYRVDFTGQVPFEVESIHVRPGGFRLKFTQPPNKRAREAIVYRVEHYRYEYSGAYGSPELDRTPVEIKSVELLPDGRTVELHLPALVQGRVYRFQMEWGLNSQNGEPLVNSQAAYTLNEIPTH